MTFSNVSKILFTCCSTRYSLTAEDLNRRWTQPDAVRHPSIYHLKGLMQYMHEQSRGAACRLVSAGVCVSPSFDDSFEYAGRPSPSPLLSAPSSPAAAATTSGSGSGAVAGAGPQTLALRLLLYCDLHGHARNRNIFLYGCHPKLSWHKEDRDCISTHTGPGRINAMLVCCVL